MTLALHYHPLSSYCWKVLIPLYEKGVEFEPVMIDFGSPDSVEAFRSVWPMGKMPVLVEGGLAIPESSIIVEYIDQKTEEGPKLIPADPAAALQVRLRDRFYDLFVHLPMQKIVGDRLRPEGSKDPHGVEEARQTLHKAYELIEGCFAPAPWAAGESFTLADCSASPALFYADKVEPFGEGRPSLTDFLDRLKARPAFARVLEEAEPFFQYFPA
jgi:glutathione S-transferase